MGEPMPVTLAFYAFGTFGLALVLVPAVRALAARFGFVAAPSPDRWHRTPTPLMGGVPIFLATLAAAIVVRPLQPLSLVMLTGLAMFGVGLTDDFVHLKPSTKLVAQIGVASVLVFFGYRLEWVQSLTLDAMLTMFWIVGITNAVNLLDNMDGLCGGVALVVAVSLLASIAPVEASRPLACYLAALAGAIAGFLVYNVHPASIFMGDGGSLFIGFTLAAVALQLPIDRRDPNVMVAVAAPVLVMLLPIFDTMLVTASRLLSGRRASQGGRDHSSHRLVAIGLSERNAVLVLWALAALGAMTGWAIQHVAPGLGAITISLFAVSMILFAAFLSRVHVYEGGTLPATPLARLTPVVMDFVHKSRVAEVLMDVCLITIAYYSAYRLRFGGPQYREYFPRFLESLPIVLSVQLVVLYAVGAYRGVWRYFGLFDAAGIAKAVGLGTLITIGSLVYVFRFADYSRSVFVIYAMVLMLLATGSRASFRLMGDFVRRRRLGDRVVIYGAGGGGALAMREYIESDRRTARLLGFVDDDPHKHRARVHGYPVLGGYDSLVSLIQGGAVDEVVISTPRLDSVRLAALEQLCADQGIRIFRLHVHLELVSAVS
jgi:UDP-GlcNAc:undecaprenyl-phosphate GlcNAc-1-phosphate transferase